MVGAAYCAAFGTAFGSAVGAAGGVVGGTVGGTARTGARAPANVASTIRDAPARHGRPRTTSEGKPVDSCDVRQVEAAGM